MFSGGRTASGTPSPTMRCLRGWPRATSKSWPVGGHLRCSPATAPPPGASEPEPRTKPSTSTRREGRKRQPFRSAPAGPFGLVVCKSSDLTVASASVEVEHETLGDWWQTFELGVGRLTCLGVGPIRAETLEGALPRPPTGAAVRLDRRSVGCNWPGHCRAQHSGALAYAPYFLIKTRHPGQDRTDMG